MDKAKFLLPSNLGDPADVLRELQELGWISISDKGDIKWIRELSQDKDLHILHLEQRLRSQKRQLTESLETINRFAKRLDAMWWVWCDGPCSGGVARYSDAELTEDIIKIAETNTYRLRTKFKELEHQKRVARGEVAYMFTTCPDCNHKFNGLFVDLTKNNNKYIVQCGNCHLIYMVEQYNQE